MLLCADAAERCVVADIHVQTGAEIAGYRIETLLGRGGMSVVYVAEQLRLGRRAALKVLAPELAQQEGYRERFIRESRIAASLDHPNIIPIYDAGEAEGVLYIAMRYVEGSDLGALLKAKGPLSLGQAIFLVEQLASALDTAHRRGLIHRDVKPANVLMEDASERVFLTDFGVAKETTASGLTKTGSFLGSVDYAAPEQLEGLPVDFGTDVYALGGVLYSCLTGLAPFEKTSEIAVAQAHMTEPPPRITSQRPGLPYALDAVVEQAMAKPMDHRFASCSELAAAARSASLAPTTRAGVRSAVVANGPGARPTQIAAEPAQQAEPAGGGDAREPPRRPDRRGPATMALIIGVAALIAALGAGLGVYFVTRGDDSNSASAGSTMNKMTTGSTATTANAANTPKARLAAYLDEWPWKCHPAQQPPAGAAASDDCTTKAGPDALQISVFSKMKPMMNDYDELVSASPRRNRTDSGRCFRTRWSGETDWVHSAGGEIGGRVLCYITGGASHIVWTLEGNPNALFVGRLDDPGHLPLARWWENMRHVTLSGGSMHGMGS